jgi:hypothetical protein
MEHPMIGKSILVGLTYRQQSGVVTEQQQIFGEITKIIPEDYTMEIEEPDGSSWFLPFYPDTILPAPRGVYRCSSNGLEIKNPELLMSWQITTVSAEESRDWEPNYQPISAPVKPREWEFEYVVDEAHQQKTISEKGSQYVGKHLLIGIRYYQSNAAESVLIRQEQLHGEIVRANAKDGIVVKLANGEEKRLPPDLALLEPATPGAEYRLKTTGEVVTNADYITTWEVHHPKENA